MAESGWKWLETAKKRLDGWKWLEMTGMATLGWKWVILNTNFQISSKQLALKVIYKIIIIMFFLFLLILRRGGNSKTFYHDYVNVCVGQFRKFMVYNLFKMAIKW